MSFNGYRSRFSCFVGSSGVLGGGVGGINCNYSVYTDGVETIQIPFVEYVESDVVDWENPENVMFDVYESESSGWENPENVMFYTGDSSVEKGNYLTEKVIILVMDGARYSETFGEGTMQYIPNIRDNIMVNGVMNTEFYNTGTTNTVNGHTAMTTGVNEAIDNTGNDLPNSAGLFQMFRKYTGAPQNKSAIITSKDKLEVLEDTDEPEYGGEYPSKTDCGTNGNPSDYRDDDITITKVLECLNTDKPDLMLVNFQQPDTAGHSGVWQDYLDGISSTDGYINQIWNHLNSDPYYVGKTTVFITNDHGRHDDDNGGFQNHGDGCDGCRHVGFVACGPDFKSNVVTSVTRDLRDIASTAAELLGIALRNSDGNIMTELLER